MLAFAFLIAAQEPVVEPPPAPPVEVPVAAPSAPSAPSAPLPVACVRDDVAHTRTVLAAFAEQGQSERVTTAISSGTLAAGLIGAGISYYAVSHLDGNLSRLDAQDTELAGAVIAAGAVLPAAVMVSSIVLPSKEEERLAAFDAAPPEQKVQQAKQSLQQEAQSFQWAPVLGGSALVVGGLGAGGLGAYFLLLPHLPNPRGPMTHGTGSELIGGGVAALGVGIALIATSPTTASTQLQLLE